MEKYLDSVKDLVNLMATVMVNCLMREMVTQNYLATGKDFVMSLSLGLRMEMHSVITKN
jgi:hypothetical protein